MTTSTIIPTSPDSTRAMLACGIVSSVLYVAMFMLIPFLFEGYSISDHTVSELSAIGAPTRTLWVIMAAVYIILFAAFGWGVLRTAEDNHLLRRLGYLILTYCIFNLYWPPMHLRGNPTSLTDTLHIVWTFVTVSLMITLMVIGALALGKSFRIYTVVTIITLVIFGALTSLNAGNIPKNLPTPLMGVFERINIGVFMLWVVVLGFALLRRVHSRI